MQSFRVLVCLFYGAFFAAAAVHGVNPSAFSARQRLREQRPDQLQVHQQEGASQSKLPVPEPFTWKYPVPPADEEPKYPPHFELKSPTTPNSVTAVCGDNTVQVEVQKDLLGIGKLVRPADVLLGDCSATSEDLERQTLIFESELHGCGSQLLMSDDSFVYIFTLKYTPRPTGNSPIIRMTDVSVTIQCHYPRKHDVSSGHLKPTWMPFSANVAVEESLHFSLSLLTDDLQHTRVSHEFLLGDMMKLEATVKQFHHAPLRVTVDSCVATVVPLVDTVPRYTFLGNNGCLFDSQLTGSSSQFLPRTQDDKLQFEVEAFRFQQENTGVIYVTCSLRATSAESPVDSTNKACSFSNGWREASGRNHACSCCDTDCGTGSKNDLTGSGHQWEEDATVGPITIKERPL